MGENEFGIIYAAAYGSLADAREDFEGIKDLHKEKWIGKYESALFTKEEDGSVKIHDTDATTRGRGLKIGAAAGAAVGLIFPVTILAGALVGGGAGLLGGHLSRGLKRSDIKELGDLLDAGEAGIVPVTILAGALVGGGAGLLGGHLSRGLKRGDIKELGDLLDAGEAGIVLVGVVTPDEGIERFLKRAAKVMKKQVDADADELKKAIDEAVEG